MVDVRLAVAVALLAIACRANEPSATPPRDGGSVLALAGVPPAGGAPPGPERVIDHVMHHPVPEYDERGHVGPQAWSEARWRTYCRGVRTSYNPDHDLRDDALTLKPGDPRWPDFVFWTLDNKINEHQTEAYGGSGWHGPSGGVIFHWAPGSHWERDTLHSFGFTIGHIIGEHRWTDTMFPDFFEKYGGVYGINLKDRLAEIAPRSNAPWIAFLAYASGTESPYNRYLLHIDTAVDFSDGLVTLTAGQGVAFDYSFDRYYDELAMILTDCKAVDFFRMYDRFGRGFAAQGNWAHQRVPAGALARVGFAGELGEAWGAPPESAEAEEVPVPEDLPDADRMRRGQALYYRECVACHGIRGDGAGFLGERFDVRPRDFTQGVYELRSTTTGELPAIADLERTIRRGVPGTTMPAWGQFLDDEQIGDVARYLIVFSPRFVQAWRAGVHPRVLPVTPAPAEVSALAEHPTGDAAPCEAGATGRSSLACTGQRLFVAHACRECHGDDRRGDGPSAEGLIDAWGHPVRPADLTYKWQFKHGDAPEDVYRAIFAGLDGSQMTAYASQISDEHDRWALVAYVLSLSPPERPVLHAQEFAAQRTRRIGPNGRVLPAR